MAFKRVNTIDPDTYPKPKGRIIGWIVIPFVIFIFITGTIGLLNSPHKPAHRYYIETQMHLGTIETDKVGVTAYLYYGDSASRGDYRIIGSVVSYGPIQAVDSLLNAVRADAEVKLQLCIKYHIQ